MASLRETFPNGLVQPEGAFRSSVDALLLAALAAVLLPPPSVAEKKPPYFVDLGTGCGMAACALALRAPHVVGSGIDIQPPLIDAARRNVTGLELGNQLRVDVADVGELTFLRQLCGTGDAHVVMANPPYLKEGEGRPSQQPMRQTALQGQNDTLYTFCRAARVLLRHHGYFCLIIATPRLGDMLAALREHEMGTRALRCVHTRPGRPAALVLVTARKNAAEDIQILPPLHIYAAAEGDEYTPESRGMLFKR